MFCINRTKCCFQHSINIAVHIVSIVFPQGDGGGPLVFYNDGHWVLHGVVGWGLRCGLENKPGVYAKASNYVDWITETILNNQ